MATTRETELLELLAQAKIDIAERDRYIEQVSQPPFPIGSVVEVLAPDWIVVQSANGLCEMAADPAMQLRPGHLVRFNQAGTLDAISKMTAPGIPCTIGQLMPGNRVEVSAEHSKMIISCNGFDPKPGQRGLMDRSATCLIELFPEAIKNAWSFDADTHVTWEMIGGQDDAITALREAIEMPQLHQELYRVFGKKPVKGVLLEGPPGCGKTMLGKATATALSKIYGGSKRGFFYVKGPELLDKYVGETEAHIRDVFSKARMFHRVEGHPAVVFIDEADAIVPKRGGDHWNGVMNTVVPQFLSEMDGLDESSTLVLLATNRPGGIDAAVVRDGRVDRKVQVNRPDQVASRQIFELYLKGVPLELSVEQSAEFVTGELFRGDRKLAGIVSGAMIAGIVDKATTVAIRRTLAADKKATKGHVTKQDLVGAVSLTQRESQNVSHTV